MLFSFEIYLEIFFIKKDMLSIEDFINMLTVCPEVIGTFSLTMTRGEL